MKKIVLSIGLLAVAMGGTFIIEGAQPRRDMPQAKKLAQQYMDGDLEARPFIEKLFKDKKLGSRLSPSKDFKSHAQANTVRLLYTGLVDMGEDQEAKKVLKYASESQQPVMWVVVAQNKAAKVQEKKAPGKMAAKPETLSPEEQAEANKAAQSTKASLDESQKATLVALSAQEKYAALQKAAQAKQGRNEVLTEEEKTKLAEAKTAADDAAKKSAAAIGDTTAQGASFMSKYRNKIAGSVLGGAALGGTLYMMYRLFKGEPVELNAPLLEQAGAEAAAKAAAAAAEVAAKAAAEAVGNEAAKAAAEVAAQAAAQAAAEAAAEVVTPDVQKSVWASITGAVSSVVSKLRTAPSGAFEGQRFAQANAATAEFLSPLFDARAASDAAQRGVAAAGEVVKEAVANQAVAQTAANAADAAVTAALVDTGAGGIKAAIQYPFKWLGSLIGTAAIAAGRAIGNGSSEAAALL